MTDRWSEENIAIQRAANLQKAREALRLKRETNLRLPFTVTPVPPEGDIVVEKSKIIIPEEKSYAILGKEKLSEIGYTILYSFSSIAIALAVPVVVGYIRDSILLPITNPTHSDLDRAKPYNANSNPHYRDIIFRKV